MSKLQNSPVKKIMNMLNKQYEAINENGKLPPKVFLKKR